MPDRGAVLWTIVAARDASLARFAATRRRMEATLVEKEAHIQRMTADTLEKEAHIRRMTADVLQKEEALRKLTGDLTQKERELDRVTRDLEDKQANLARLTADLKAKEKSLSELTAESTEKEDVIRELETALREKSDIKRFNTTLEEKEGVIADQRRALMAYRATFAVFGWLIHPLNHLHLAVKSAWRGTLNAMVPRLGVLYQHDPVPMALPASYATPPKLENPPRISIVTPSFKQAGFIERTILSVVDQGYPNLEYYVQDGGSPDGTVEVLKRHEHRLTGWQSKPDRGQAQAINRAFALTNGEIMAYLNSDDLLLPGSLAYVAAFFQRNPDVDVVYGHRIVINEKDQQIGRWVLPGHSDKVLSWADYVPQETLFWRRAIWEKAGGRMDESFQFALDWDLLVRFRDAGARFARLPRFLGGFRVHPQQKTTAEIADTGFQEMNRIRQRALGRVPTSIEVRKAVAPYLMRHMVTDFFWKIANRLGMHK